MPQITTKFLEPYITYNVRHTHYDVCCEKAHEIDIHASGLYPDKLIGERRPAESEQIQAYRK